MIFLFFNKEHDLSQIIETITDYYIIIYGKPSAVQNDGRITINPEYTRLIHSHFVDHTIMNYGR